MNRYGIDASGLYLDLMNDTAVVFMHVEQEMKRTEMFIDKLYKKVTSIEHKKDQAIKIVKLVI